MPDPIGLDLGYYLTLPFQGDFREGLGPDEGPCSRSCSTEHSSFLILYTLACLLSWARLLPLLLTLTEAFVSVSNSPRSPFSGRILEPRGKGLLAQDVQSLAKQRVRLGKKGREMGVTTTLAAGPEA